MNNAAGACYCLVKQWLHTGRHEVLDECIVLIVLQERDQLRNIVADILTFALVRVDVKIGHDT